MSLRIILVMIEPPLPFGNAAARWFYVLLKELVERGHRVTAFAACSKQSDLEKAKLVFPPEEYDLRLFPFPKRNGFGSKLETLLRPYSYMFSREMKRQLEEELSSPFDVLHLEQLWSGWLGLKHIDKTLINVHHLTWIDQEYIRPASFSARFQRALMFRGERMLVRRLKNFRSCSPRLVPEMQRINPKGSFTTVPVGIDPKQYQYIEDNEREASSIVSVIGNMTWYPSQSAATRLMTRLWPEIKRRVPNAKVQLIGWDAKSVLSDFVGLPDVIVEENVPDMKPFFEKTSVMCYPPARGSGMKIKILESLGYGIPIVTTSEGVEGLPAVDGTHAGICEDDQGLIDRTVRLLQCPQLQNRQRLAGRTLLEQHCGPKPTVDAIEGIYRKMQQKLS